MTSEGVKCRLEVGLGMMGEAEKWPLIEVWEWVGVGWEACHPWLI